jgi:Ulp1 family protease
MDARYPERYLTDRRVSRLSDAEHRAYVLALVWSVSNRTDGAIAVEDLDALPRPVTRETLDALHRAGLVSEEVVNGDLVWLLTDYVETQTTRAELEALDSARRAKRLKAADKRAEEAHKIISAVTSTTEDRDSDSDSDSASDSASASESARIASRKPRRSRKPGKPEPVVDIQTGEPVTEWDTVQPGTGSLPPAVGADDEEIF